MKPKAILAAALALLMATGCQGQNKQEVKQSNSNAMSKSIVIFFSHAGDNYQVGNIEVGNTKIVAAYVWRGRQRLSKPLKALKQWPVRMYSRAS